jgi:hypothetical protein
MGIYPVNIDVTEYHHCQFVTPIKMIELFVTPSYSLYMYAPRSRPLPLRNSIRLWISVELKLV